MGVKLHGIADDIGDLYKLPVIIFIQRMKDPALNRLQPVLDIRNGPVADDIGGIGQEVVVDQPFEGAVIHRGNITDHDTARQAMPTNRFARDHRGRQFISTK